MKKLFLMALLCLLIAPVTAQASARALTYISTQTFTPSSSTVIVVPSATTYLIVHIRTAGVHINWSGAAATTADGYWPPGIFPWDNQRNLFQGATVITSSDGTAVVSIDYFR